MKWLCALAGVACLGLGCGGAGNSTVSSAQSNGTCPSDPSSLPGSGAVGASCGSYTDCAPVCCTCANGDGNGFAAAECDDGSCAATSVACADAQESDGASLCP
jgi:hypothetical protein